MRRLAARMAFSLLLPFVLKEFYAPLRNFAEKSAAAFVDQYAITRAVLERMEQDNRTDVRPFDDGFHTASPGGLFIDGKEVAGYTAEQLAAGINLGNLSSTASG